MRFVDFISRAVLASRILPEEALYGDDMRPYAGVGYNELVTFFAIEAGASEADVIAWFCSRRNHEAASLEEIDRRHNAVVEAASRSPLVARAVHDLALEIVQAQPLSFGAPKSVSRSMFHRTTMKAA